MTPPPPEPDPTLTIAGIGSQLGPYKIEAAIGKGGMGEVFRAMDTRLGRKVALKISHVQFDSRFEREARAIAALNHPHICTLHDVGPNYLVMELVEGETLAARLKKGKLPIEQTIQYGEQIADALAAAHAKGIVHRDLKPGNIMLTKSGVKVLDFGLAKSLTDDTLTAINAVMGTPAYMAPEQLEGREADARTDIYALGLVLAEMATGKRARQGEPFLSGELESQLFSHIVMRCLTKDPDERWQAASDVRRELIWAGQSHLAQTTFSQAISRTAVPQQRGAIVGAGSIASWGSITGWGSIAGWIAAGILLLVAAGLGWLYLRGKPEAQVVRSTLTLPGTSVSLHSFNISPDGRTLAIAAQVNGKRQLWLRALDSFEANALPGTEDAMYPFWSPDSRLIGFFADGKLKKIAAAGGPVQSLCVAANGRGGTWNRDDVIVFAPNGINDGVLQRVSAGGGDPIDVTSIKGGSKHPAFLSDGRHFLFMSAGTSADQTGIYLGSLDNNDNRKVLPDISGIALVPGFLLFVRDNTLVAQPVDDSTGLPKGAVIPIAAGVSKTSNLDYAPVTASETGLLVYQTGGELGANQFTKVGRDGKVLATVGTPGHINNPALSQDERWLMYTRPAVTTVDVWLRDLHSGAERRFITTPLAIDGMPQWSPNADYLAFQSDRLGIENIYVKSIGGGQENPLLVNSYSKIPTQWSRDGRYIVYTQTDPKTKRDIWVLPIDGAKLDTKVGASVFLNTEANESLGQLSRDSRWMAYTSDETGQPEVSVRAFPKGPGLFPISLAGGSRPHWSFDGTELFFVAADGKMMAVKVKSSTTSFESSPPIPLFDANLVRPPNEPLLDYDVFADGTFLLDRPAAGSTAATLNVVTNWLATLNK